MTIILFILLFGILVFVHELGHFVFAKIVGVKVEKFSLGYGPKLLSRKWGETEYLVSALPLGGYVKLLGEDPTEEISDSEKQRTFQSKRGLAKSLIVVMGPVFNLILPVIIFSFVYFIGFPAITSQIGEVLYDSPAYKAGLLPGDKIIAVDDKEIWSWDELSSYVVANSDKKINFQVLRDDKILEIRIKPEEEISTDNYGNKEYSGKVGILPSGAKPIIGHVYKGSEAFKAGFRAYDEILNINERKIRSYYDLKKYIANLTENKNLNIKIKRKKEEVALNINSKIFKEEKYSLPNASIYPAKFFIEKVEKDSPAEEAGILPNDMFYSINNIRIIDDMIYMREMQANTGEPVDLTVLRNGEKKSFKIIPEKIKQKDDYLDLSTKYFRIGIQFGSHALLNPPEVIDDPFAKMHLVVSLKKGFLRTYEVAKMTIVGFYKLLVGDVSVKAIASPIMIFKLTGVVYEQGGFIQFIKLIAFLSIVIGLVNLFPIPVLDGGHLTIFAIEGIIRRPLKTKVREVAQQIGFYLLILLAIVAFYNDIVRFWF